MIKLCETSQPLKEMGRTSTMEGVAMGDTRPAGIPTRYLSERD